jgi:hypothetical protein
VLTAVRSREVTERIVLHLQRFAEYLLRTYGHERLDTLVRRDIAGWRDALVSSGVGPSTVNNHLASLAGFCGWVAAQAPDALPPWSASSRRRTACTSSPTRSSTGTRSTPSAPSKTSNTSRTASSSRGLTPTFEHINPLGTYDFSIDRQAGQRPFRAASAA